MLPPSKPVLSPPELHPHFSVPFDYRVAFTVDAFAPDNLVLRDLLRSRESTRRHRAIVLLDQGVQAAWPALPARVSAYFACHREQLDLVAPPVPVVAGEKAKTDPDLIPALHRLFFDHHLDRHSFAIVVGGGGVLDAVGFAAATAHRGIRVVRVPTTVLAQNDSGVGVKNGINAFGAKNFVGTFAPPFAVLNDAAFLTTLPRREAVAGLAEAVKVALIRDPVFFDWLERQSALLAAQDPATLTQLIHRCAELHLQHIALGGDPFEQGSARPLDFGHWSAHKLESLTHHEVRHGEAVAIGLLLDSRYAVEIGLLPEAAFQRIAALLQRLTLPTWHEALGHRDDAGRLQILQGLEDFREHLGGDLTVTLIADIGAALDVHEMQPEAINRAVQWLQRAAGGQP